jgi:aminopeptidase N
VPQHDSAAALATIRDAGRRKLELVEGASPAALAAARLVAATTSDAELLARWAADEGRPAAASGDKDFGWAVVRRSASLGHLDGAQIDRVASEDSSMSGHLSELRARAALPTESAKAWAWNQLYGESKLSNYEGLAVAEGFFDGYGENDATELLRGYADRFFAELPGVPQRYGDMAAEKFVIAAFPHRVIEPAVADAARTAIASPDNTAGVRRSLTDALDRLDRALLAHQRFGATTATPVASEG